MNQIDSRVTLCPKRLKQGQFLVVFGSSEVVSLVLHGPCPRFDSRPVLPVWYGRKGKVSLPSSAPSLFVDYFDFQEFLFAHKPAFGVLGRA